MANSEVGTCCRAIWGSIGLIEFNSIFALKFKKTVDRYYGSFEMFISRERNVSIETHSSFAYLYSELAFEEILIYQLSI